MEGRRTSEPFARGRIEPHAVARYATRLRRGEERALAEERTEQVIAAMGLPDMAVQSDELPWVPQGERVWFKPLRFDLATGRWINLLWVEGGGKVNRHRQDRKSTRLNSSHANISYAVFCLKKKKKTT